MSGCLFNSTVERYRYTLISLLIVPTKKKSCESDVLLSLQYNCRESPIDKNRYSIFLRIPLLILYFIIFATQIYDPLLIPFVRSKF